MYETVHSLYTNRCSLAMYETPLYKTLVTRELDRNPDCGPEDVHYLHRTFIVQYNNVHYIAAHCSVIATSQAWRYY